MMVSSMSCGLPLSTEPPDAPFCCWFRYARRFAGSLNTMLRPPPRLRRRFVASRIAESLRPLLFFSSRRCRKPACFRCSSICFTKSGVCRGFGGSGKSDGSKGGSGLFEPGKRGCLGSRGPGRLVGNCGTSSGFLPTLGFGIGSRRPVIGLNLVFGSRFFAGLRCRSGRDISEPIQHWMQSLHRTYQSVERVLYWL